jgi:hypothetical protein
MKPRNGLILTLEKIGGFGAFLAVNLGMKSVFFRLGWQLVLAALGGDFQ